MADYFSWLHVSDLHFGQKGQKSLWSNVRQAFFDDLARMHDRCGPVHAVLFTGDLACAGTEEQFLQLESEVLARLFAELERLGSGDAVLLAVPGNHDLARPDIKAKMPPALRQLLRPGGIDEIDDEFWNSSDTEYHQVIGKAFAGYTAWWEKTPWRKGTLVQVGLLSGDFAATLTVGERRIGIVGLNTTFLQLTGDDYRKRLVWHPAQLDAVCGDPTDWAKSHDACLLLTHQAGEWLTDNANNIAGPEIYPAGRFAAQLFGHMHDNDIRGFSKGSGPARFMWQAASLFGMEKYGHSPNQVSRRHGYTLGRFEFGKRNLMIRCWPRAASYDQNGWRLHADHSVGPLEKDEGTKSERVGLSKRKVTASLTEKKRLSASIEVTQRALLTTYLRSARGLWDIVDLAGLPEDDRHIAMQKFMLRQLYMPLRMVIEEVSDDSAIDSLELRRTQQRLSEAGRTEVQESRMSIARHSLGEWLAEVSKIKEPDGQYRTPRLVILGDPGGGKSTLLRWLATACLLWLENSGDFALLPDAESLPTPDWVPILIRCRELDKTTLGQGSLEDILRQTLPKLELSISNIEALIALLRERLEKGTAIILIDGLDEITDSNQRIAFCDRVEVIARYYSRSPVLATSRIVGYREMRKRIGGGFSHGTLDDLLPEEKDKFVERWCDVTISDPLRRLSESDALRRGIHGNDRVARLTGNPMLLTTMALVQRKVGKLPPKRHKLYWEAVDLLLRWRASPDEPPLDSDEALPQLEYIAYSMCDRGVQRLRRDEVLAQLSAMRIAYPDIRPVHRQTPEQFLAILERRTGLLTEMGAVQHDGRPIPVYEFRHLTFQEYLAALSLVRSHFPGHSPRSSLAERIAPLAGRIESAVSPIDGGEMVVAESWREALRLCVASCNDDDVSSVLDAILRPFDEEERRPRAILAAQCLADEPNVQRAQAERILAGVASQVVTDEGGGYAGTALERAAIELATGDWGAALEVNLVREFLVRQPGRRSSVGGLAGMVALERAKLANTGSPDWMPARVEELQSVSDEEAARAALAIMHVAWATATSQPDTPIFIQSTPKAIAALLTLLRRKPAIAHAGAWALGWMAYRPRDGAEIWRPDIAERAPLLEYLANPKNDSEALRWIAIMAYHQRWQEAMKSLLVLSEATDIELRRSVTRALAVTSSSDASNTLRKLLKDDDSEVRKSALRGLAEFRDAIDGKIIAGASDDAFFWLDPAEVVSQQQISRVAKRLKIGTADVRRRLESMARDFGFKLEVEAQPKKRPGRKK